MITSGSLRDTPDSGTSGPGAAVPPPWARCPGLAVLGLGCVVGTTPREGHLARGRECRSVSASPCSFRTGARWWGWPGLRPGRHDGQSEMSARRRSGWLRRG